MTDQPLISIVIPSLNQGRFLRAAIDSVLTQSHPRVEVIVMDGGSNDGSIDIVRACAHRLKHWESAPDRGPADAINRGFARATGDVFGVLNADDFLLPGSLAKVAACFRRAPDAGVVSGHGYFADLDGALQVPTFSDAWHSTRFRHGACVLLQPATFFRRAAFQKAGGVRESGVVCWDKELWADFDLTGAKFLLINDFLACFRLHPGSITGGQVSRADRLRDARKVMARVKGRPESGWDRLLQYGFRAVKFARHPIRTVRQRLFFRRLLQRWSI